MPKARSKKFKKRSFHGNRHRNSVPKNNVSTASATKLNTLESSDGLEYDFQELKGNRIIDIQTLLGVFSILSCPKCFATGLKLTEDSKEGLCSNFAIVCKCGFMAGFTSTPKENKKCSLNTLLVFGLRLMGRGFSAGMKLLCTLNLPYVCKKTFRIHELKLLEAVKYSCEENMKAASKEVQNLKKTTTCGVSVDGTWQRRGHMSLNGCVSVISIDTGKILDLEVMTQYCKMCEMNIKCDHECSNYKGSSGNMESVGAFRIFERSVMKRELQYTEYYGDGDSKAFLKVKDIYGEDTVTKLECIGHVQKRVGSRLRKLKKKPKDSVEKGMYVSCHQLVSPRYGAGTTTAFCTRQELIRLRRCRQYFKTDVNDQRLMRPDEALDPMFSNAKVHGGDWSKLQPLLSRNAEIPTQGSENSLPRWQHMNTVLFFQGSTCGQSTR
ncbi:hypothetical protein AVEN_217722-1 [Araneus ventricosus]|uniref:Mutator-like transposase domain-containing protein n=2 Tax=Araneus ventricosus TaxID=182803 RepID=A0A4Y2NLK6_ARAVE|nr:hypothetical protein AVEN_217722-1 [Araneus ventricosus]